MIDNTQCKLRDVVSPMQVVKIYPWQQRTSPLPPTQCRNFTVSPKPIYDSESKRWKWRRWQE